jgi:heterodisulfide reductase subunit A-like polyferredoxin
VLVAGTGIDGIQSALDPAGSGFKVYLLDSAPAIGGTMTEVESIRDDCQRQAAFKYIQKI